MNVFTRIRRKLGAWIAGVKAEANYGNFVKWFSPSNIFTRLASNTLANNEVIFSIVSRLGNSMGAMPVKLKDGNHRELTDHPSYDLIVNSPNPNMHGMDFIRTMEVIRNSTGNAYAIKEYDSRFQQVKALWILDPGKVKDVIEKNTRELWYEIQGEERTYHAHNMDVIHLKHIHGFGYRGISPIDVLRGSTEFDRKVKEFSLDQIDGAITASFILELTASVNDELKKQIIANFEDFYKDNGGLLIQEAGTTIKELKERNFIDTKLFEVERITRTRVATVFNVPPHMAGESEGMPYNSREQASLDYVQGTLVPICTQYEKEFNRKLLTAADRKRGLHFKFNTNALLRGDMKTRGDFYFKGIRSGLFKPNECRAWEDLPPEPGGDKLYMSRDLSPIEDRKQVIEE